MAIRRERYGGPARARAVLIALAGAALWCTLSGVAAAHEVRRVGNLEVVVGWAGEPAYAGYGNEVQVVIRRDGRPVEGAKLQVVVAFGGEAAPTQTQPIPLDPSFSTPNEYLGYIIPTRPGTYSFHVTGTVGSRSFDETFTSGPETFDDVHNPADAEFPVRDATRGELTARLERLAGRIGQGSSDPVARWLAGGALVAALAGLALALGRGRSA